MGKDSSAEKGLEEIIRELRKGTEKLRKGRVGVYVWWEKPPVEREHEVEFVERWHEAGKPDPKVCVLLKLDGREVKVERFTVEEWKERAELVKKEQLQIRCAGVGFVNVSDAIVEHFLRKGEKTKIPDGLKKALVFYRLLWHFGPSYRLWSGDISGCDFLVKYKGYVFRISDNAELDNVIDIDAEVLVPGGVVWDHEAKKKYRPPADVCEEVLAIVKFLTKYPVLHRDSTTYEYLLD